MLMLNIQFFSKILLLIQLSFTFFFTLFYSLFTAFLLSFTFFSLSSYFPLIFSCKSSIGDLVLSFRIRNSRKKVSLLSFLFGKKVKVPPQVVGDTN
jgi:hypothetical protein